jgi:hypothetical protein
MQTYNSKIKISGNWLYDYQYYSPICFDFESKNTPKRSGGIDDSDDASIRAKKEVRDLIYCNLPGVYDQENSNKFITLTFDPKETYAENLDIFVSEHKNFIKRLRYSKYFKGAYIRYLTVPELHKSGLYHGHTVIFDSPYIPKQDLADIWGNGFVKINKIKNDEHLANYINKYITKDFRNGLYNRKSYFPSRKLLRPRDIIEPIQVSDIRAKVAGIIPNWVSPKRTQLEGYKKLCDIKIYNLVDYPEIIRV